MGNVAFEAFPKIPRLNRNITITEKIDWTNAAVVIVPLAEIDHIAYSHTDSIDLFEPAHSALIARVGDFFVFAQSRNRFITPGADNYGFARWVQANAEALVTTLGPGRHFGEWWGSGIQRGYGLTKGDKRFSLFNTGRWSTEALPVGLPALGLVPTLYSGPFDQLAIDLAVANLDVDGSVAAEGYDNPEGIVVWHEAARQSFKVLLEGDAVHKGAAGHALDEEKVAA